MDSPCGLRGACRAIRHKLVARIYMWEISVFKRMSEVKIIQCEEKEAELPHDRTFRSDIS